MSYRMWSIDDIYFQFNRNYVIAIKNEALNSKIPSKELNNFVKDYFPEDWKTCSEEELVENVLSNLLDGWEDTYRYSYEENYAFRRYYNQEGEIMPYGEYVDEDIIVVNLFSDRSNLFKPDYDSLEQFLDSIRKIVYIPKDYNVFENQNIIYLSGVMGG